jgi:Sugar-transfer associated ATP-grasp
VQDQGEGAAPAAWKIVGRKLAAIREVCAEAGSLVVAAVRAGAGSVPAGLVRREPKSTADAAERSPTGPPKPAIDLAEAFSAATVSSGKSTGQLLREIVALWCGPGRLTPREYFYYRLHDKRYTDAERRRFRGRAAQLRINRRTRSFPWTLVANDKLLFYAVTQGLGYPTPGVLAVYHPSRAFGRAAGLRDAAELAAFLREGMRYPCFAKPVLGMYSYGGHAIMSVDRAGDALRFWDGRSTGIDEFTGTLDRSDRGGYLFQEFREPHPAIAALCGPRLATVRLVVTFRSSGPAVFRAVWKVPTGINVADNFWRPGNVLCALDPASGTVRRAIRGYGAALEELEVHPDSGAPLLGFTLPCWHELVALTLDAARSFVSLRLQAWDVAVCPDGPLLVELNAGGDYNLPQLATGQGIMDEAFAELLAECGRTAHPVQARKHLA